MFLVQVTDGLNSSYNVTKLELNAHYEFVLMAILEVGGIVGRSPPSSQAHHSGKSMWRELLTESC